MTPGVQKIVDDARAAGLEVKESPSGSVDIIRKRHRGTGRVLDGWRLYPNGTAVDLTVDLGVSKGVRNLKAIRKHLGLAMAARISPQMFALLEAMQANKGKATSQGDLKGTWVTVGRQSFRGQTIDALKKLGLVKIVDSTSETVVRRGNIRKFWTFFYERTPEGEKLLDSRSTGEYHLGMTTQSLPRPIAQLAVEAAMVATRVTWPAWHDVTGSIDEIRAKLSSQEIKRHKTAISRKDFSVPIKALMRKGILTPETTLFDYGCGRGDDIRLLKEKGYEVGGWDPYWAPKNEKTQADIVNLGFVLNVIEDPEERSEVLQKAWDLAKGALIVSTRPPMKHSFKAYSDGYVTSSGTFQKFWKTDELKAWLQEELGAEPVGTGSPCCFILYKNDEAKEKLAA